MKLVQINKLYSKLTPEEQASLVVEAAARLDGKTIDEIVENVERKTYISMHSSFTQRINIINSVICIYATEYWKNKALMLLSMLDGEFQSDELANQFFEKSVALEIVIRNICDRLKIAVSAIKTMTSALPDYSEDYALPIVNQSLIKNYEEMFGSIIS